jgi:hypothetical protein
MLAMLSRGLRTTWTRERDLDRTTQPVEQLRPVAQPPRGLATLLVADHVQPAEVPCHRVGTV